MVMNWAWGQLGKKYFLIPPLLGLPPTGSAPYWVCSGARRAVAAASRRCSSASSSWMVAMACGVSGRGCGPDIFQQLADVHALGVGLGGQDGAQGGEAPLHVPAPLALRVCESQPPRIHALQTIVLVALNQNLHSAGALGLGLCHRHDLRARALGGAQGRRRTGRIRAGGAGGCAL